MLQSLHFIEEYSKSLTDYWRRCALATEHSQRLDVTCISVVIGTYHFFKEWGGGGSFILQLNDSLTAELYHFSIHSVDLQVWW